MVVEDSGQRAGEEPAFPLSDDRGNFGDSVVRNFRIEAKGRRTMPFLYLMMPGILMEKMSECKAGGDVVVVAVLMESSIRTPDHQEL